MLPIPAGAVASKAEGSALPYWLNGDATGLPGLCEGNGNDVGSDQHVRGYQQRAVRNHRPQLRDGAAPENRPARQAERLCYFVERRVHAAQRGGRRQLAFYCNSVNRPPHQRRNR